MSINREKWIMVLWNSIEGLRQRDKNVFDTCY